MKGVKKMDQHYIAVEAFQYPIECFCSSSVHTYDLTINRGDIMEITDEQKYTIDNGWYFLVKINERNNFYIPINDLENFIRQEQLIAMLDIDLQINYLKFKIDQAFDTGDEASFRDVSKKLIESNELKLKLERYLYI
jgi:uncharacterized protein YpiB (UPF0302 family)